MGHGFRDNVHWISIVEQTGVRTDSLHIFDNTSRDINRAQRHKKAARPLRLLTDDAMFERNAFIQIASLEAAGTKTRQHRIAIAQSLTPVCGGCECYVKPSCSCHLASNRLHNAQAFLVEI